MTASPRTDHYAASDPDAVDAVAVVMRRVAEGTLTGAAMASRAAQRCSEVFAVCDGPTDPLWPAHVAICRAVLGFGGLPAAELAQWLAVARNRENPEGANLYPPAPDSDSEPYRAAQTDVGVHDDANADGQADDLADISRDVLAEAEAAAWAVIDRYRRQREAADH